LVEHIRRENMSFKVDTKSKKRWGRTKEVGKNNEGGGEERRRWGRTNEMGKNEGGGEDYSDGLVGAANVKERRPLVERTSGS